jgi:hypothetical protein
MAGILDAPQGILECDLGGNPVAFFSKSNANF